MNLLQTLVSSSTSRNSTELLTSINNGEIYALSLLMFTRVVTALTQNDFVFVGFVATVVTFLFKFSKNFWNRLKNSMVVSVTVAKKDESYKWVTAFLHEQQEAMKARNLMVETRRRYEGYDETGTTIQVLYLPAPGWHVLWWNKCRFVIHNSKAPPSTIPEVQGRDEKSQIVIYTWGWNCDSIKKLLATARNDQEKRTTNKILTFVAEKCNHSPWGQGAQKTKRGIGSVFLPKGVAENIIEDVREFRKRKAWYNLRGVPHRRGYLLHGPPGTGKSSFILAMASELKLCICIMSLSSTSFNDNDLMTCMQKLPSNAILLLEDIDAIAPLSASIKTETEEEGDAKPAEKKKKTGVSLSGLLNAFDGIASVDGQILFMTTNHIDRIPSVLIRPGRVDVKVMIPNASHEQIRRIFLHFYGGELEKLADRFVSLIPDGKLAMSAIQGHFLRHMDDAEACVEKAVEELEIKTECSKDRLGE